MQSLKKIIYFLSGTRLSSMPSLLYYFLQKSLGINTNLFFILSMKEARFLIQKNRSDLGFIYEVFHGSNYRTLPQFVPKDGATCIDIGANIGAVSLRWLKTNSSGLIISIEPHPETYLRLCSNILLNNVTNVIPVNVAISDKSGTLQMDINRQDSMAIVSNKGGERVIKAKSLDDLIIDFNLNHIDLIKIDIEGHELYCLNGAREALSITERIVLETHKTEIACKELLETSGFKVSIDKNIMYAEKQ